MKIAIAAPYDVKSPKVWSGTPRSLYNALCSYENNEINDINLSDYHTSKLEKKNLLNSLDIKNTIIKRSPVSKLGPSVMNPLNSRILHDICKKKSYDVLFEFGGFLPCEHLPPYYIYTDSSHDMSLDYYKETGSLPFNNEYSLSEMKNASEYAKTIYQNAAGVFCMSNYLARSMVETTGVEKSKVHTVYAGANWHGVSLPEIKAKSIAGKKEINLLLVGVDYYGKGFDIAIEAVKILNSRFPGRYKLHLCGVKNIEEKSEYIINHGFVDKQTLISLLQKCDLYVLPTRFDCFGISFVEAMTFGLPCIGRKICAMPEIIDEGINGELIIDDNPENLAELIIKICENEELYCCYSEKAIEKAKIFTWENTCEKIMSIIKNDLTLE